MAVVGHHHDDDVCLAHGTLIRGAREVAASEGRAHLVGGCGAAFGRAASDDHAVPGQREARRKAAALGAGASDDRDRVTDR